MLGGDHKITFSRLNARCDRRLRTDSYAHPRRFCDLCINVVRGPVEDETEIARYCANEFTTVPWLSGQCFIQAAITRERFAAASAPPTSAKPKSAEQRKAAGATDIPTRKSRLVRLPSILESFLPTGASIRLAACRCPISLRGGHEGRTIKDEHSWEAGERLWGRLAKRDRWAYWGIAGKVAAEAAMNGAESRR